MNEPWRGPRAQPAWERGPAEARLEAALPAESPRESRPIAHLDGWILFCPVCRGVLALSGDLASCQTCASAYACLERIWRFLPTGGQAVYARFVSEYTAVRRAEGWGGDSDGYYRALPHVDESGRRPEHWRIRAASYHALLDAVVEPLEQRVRRALRVLDLGAGNGWLSHRLAMRGHVAMAVDLSDDPLDGLGAQPHYDALITWVQADFNRLPLAGAQADLVVFNASLHYATDCSKTLGEALRVLRDDGYVAVLDTPIYRDPSSGRRMLREQAERFRRSFGLASDALTGEGYLTEARLEQLSRQLGLRWETVRPRYGWRWTLDRTRAGVLARREPARFALLVGSRRASAQCVPAGGASAAHRVDRTGCVAPPRARHNLALRRVWRMFLRLRFRVIDRRRHGRLVLEWVAGMPLLVLPGVLNPALFESGKFLAECLDQRLVPTASSVLDMGTGSGIGAIAAARWASRVVAVDINPAAVRNAQLNAMLNEVESRVQVRKGDLFVPVLDERFDVVLFNPPYYRGTPRDRFEGALRSDDVAERFADGLGKHLLPGGRALVVLSSEGDADGFLKAFMANGFAADLVAERDLVSETMALYRLTRAGNAEGSSS